MELLKHLIPLLLTVSLGMLVVASGMASSRGQLLYVLLRPRLLVRAIIAIDVLPVLAAIVIVAVFYDISLPARAAIVLMAISPVPPLMPGKAFKFGGEADYVYGLQNAMAVLAIVTVPLLGSLVAGLYESDAQFPIAVVAQNILIGVIVPLAIGLVVGRWLAPTFAQRAAPILAQIANVLVIIAFIPVLAASWHEIVALVGDGTVIAMAIVVAIAALGGHLLGATQGSRRSTLAFAAAMRHPGIALALAGANHADKGISAGVLLFMLVGIVVLVPYQLALGHYAPKPPAQAGTGHPA